MSRFRFGFPTRLFELPLKDAIARAASLRVDGVQFDLRNELAASAVSETGRRHLRYLLKEHGLALAPATFPLRRPLGDEVGLEERVHVLTTTLRFAGEFKIPALILRLGAIPAEDAPGRVLLMEVLSDLARVGDHVGVTVLLATGRESTETLRGLLRDISTGPMGLAWDPAASVMAGLDAGVIMRELPQSIYDVRLRDGFRESDGAGVETALGRGEVDWEEILALLAEADYQHWLTPDRTGGDDPAGDAARAITYVRRVLPF